MLGKLLLRYLVPAWPLVLAVVVFQLAQSIASLMLPTLNADIIDNGVVKGDIPYIWSTGGVMLAVSLVQVVCAVIAVYFGSRLAMGMGRDLRGRPVPARRRVLAARGRPVRRAVAHHAQHQRRPAGADARADVGDADDLGPHARDRRRDHGGAPGRRAVVADGRRRCRLLLIIVGLIVWRMVPAFTQMQAKIDRVNQIMREQLSGIRVVRAFVREREERARFSTASEGVMATGLRAGNLMALMFPAVMLVMNVSSVAVIWFGAYQVQNAGVQIGTLFAFLNYMMQILMGVMMATFMFVMIPRAAVCAQPHRRRCSTPTPRWWRPSTRSTPPRPPDASSSITSTSPTRAPTRPCCTTSPSRSSRARRPRSSGRRAPARRRSSDSWRACSTSRRASVRVDDVDVRTLRPRRALGARRARPAARLPLLGHDRLEPALRRHGGDRRRALARPRARPGQGLRGARCPSSSRRRSLRAAPTSRAASASASRSRAPS